jgi:predicted MFS family arabinose efflux permease
MALAAVVVVVTTGVLPAFLTGALSVQMRRDLHFGEAALGGAIAGFFVGAALTSAVLGRAAERLGPELSMRLSASLSAVSLLVVAVGARSYRSLVLVLAVGGVANALSQPAANLVIARRVDASRLGLALAIKQASVVGSTLLGGLAVPTIALTVGWRWAFVAAAALAVIGAVAVPRGRDARRAASAAASGRAGDSDWLSLAVLAAGVGLGAAAAGTLGTFLVNASVRAGISEGGAGLLVAAGGATVIVVRLIAGARADRRQGGNLPIVATMLVIGAAGYLLYATESRLWLLAASPLTFAAGWGWPGLFNLAVVRANPQAPGLASGVTQTGTYIGAVLGPLLFGTLAENRSYASAWCLAASFSLAAAGFMLAGRRLLRRHRLRAEDLAVEGI